MPNVRLEEVLHFRSPLPSPLWLEVYCLASFPFATRAGLSSKNHTDGCQQLLKTHGNKICIFIGTYSIGKERILEAISNSIHLQGSKHPKTPFFVSPNKQSLFNQLRNKQITYTTDATASNIHVLGMWSVSFKNMPGFSL